NASTDGLQYSWSGDGTISDPSILNPVAQPAASTNYQITATIGGCSASDNVMVTTVPYPIANAGLDSTICFEASAQLNGSVNGTTFSWSPSATIDDPTVLNPIAFPTS